MSPELKKRLLSFTWRVVMMALAAGLAVAAENLASLELDPRYITILGLILGECSKWIRNQYVTAQ